MWIYCRTHGTPRIERKATADRARCGAARRRPTPQCLSNLGCSDRSWNLALFRHRAKLLECEQQRLADQSTDLQAVIGEAISRQRR